MYCEASPQVVSGHAVCTCWHARGWHARGWHGRDKAALRGAGGCVLLYVVPLAVPALTGKSAGLPGKLAHPPSPMCLDWQALVPREPLVRSDRTLQGQKIPLRTQRTPSWRRRPAPAAQALGPRARCGLHGALLRAAPKLPAGLETAPAGVRRRREGWEAGGRLTKRAHRLCRDQWDPRPPFSHTAPQKQEAAAARCPALAWRGA